MTPPEDHPAGSRQNAPAAKGLPPRPQPPRPRPGQAPYPGSVDNLPPHPLQVKGRPAPVGTPGAEVPAPVAATKRRLRHVLVFLGFLLCVVAPAGATGWYLWTVAADQYASRMGFSVRKEETNSALELLGGLTQISGSSSNDTDILYEFIQSQKLVRDIDDELDLRTIWSKPADDWVFRLDPEAPIEDLVDYWHDMVRLSYGAGSGLLEVEVRAFDPVDAQKIAQVLFRRSADLINDLSAIAREDSISYAREDLEAAVERLKTARETVTRFRNENQLINPEIDLQAQAGLLGSLQAQQAEALIEIDLLRETVRAGDPRLEQAQRRLAVIETRIAAEREKLGVRSTDPETGGRPMADIVGEYERLVVDREFAERAYLSALTTYDTVLAEARRKSRYLAAYSEPTLAESPEYPQRVTLLFLVTLFLFLGWSIAVLVYYSIKDRR